MIVITGATGALNGATADHLLERLPASRIAVAVRTPAKAQRFADLGVEVREADYARPETLQRAFDGAEQLLLVSQNAMGVDGVALHGAAIDAARLAGVGRVLYTSHQGAAPDNPFGPGREHFATEQLLAESGLPWTSLRNGFYAHSLGWLTGPWRETGTIVVPGDGPVSWTAREDAAEAAAVVIESDGAFDGPTTLTAEAAPTFEDVAAIAAEVAGRPVERVLMDREAWIAAQTAAGRPAFPAFYDAAAAGFFAGTDPLLARLLGRAPRTVEDALAGTAHRAALRSGGPRPGARRAAT